MADAGKNSHSRVHTSEPKQVRIVLLIRLQHGPTDAAKGLSVVL